MSSSPHDQQDVGVSIDDTRTVIRLLSEVSVLTDSHSEKRHVLMTGIAKFLDADAWVWGLVNELKDNRPASFSVFLKSGFSDERFTGYLKALERPEMTAMSAPLFSEAIRTNRHLTRNRSQLDRHQLIYSDEFSEWRDVDLAPLILSYRPTDTNHGSCVGIYRRYDAPPFTARETRIAHILLSEVAWLHAKSWPNAPTHTLFNLPPRLNTVVNLLLQGTLRKLIADQLGLSTNTVGTYIKDIYKRFEVHSQSELIHRFVSGDGGDDSDMT